MGESEKPVPNSDERMYACLAHFLQMVGWFIGPLIIFLVKRESRFVTFHAAQALLWQITFMVLGMGSFAVFFVGVFLSITHSGGAQSSSPPLFFLFFPLIWLVMMAGWALTLVFAIVYGIKAMKGEWAAYPVIGRWAKRLVGI